MSGAWLHALDVRLNIGGLMLGFELEPAGEVRLKIP